MAVGLGLDVARIGWYRELPDGNGPDLDSLRAVPGDIVVAVNTFGKADPKWWEDWRRDHPDVLYVEDHTHAPFSDWAVASDADYCVASLRKVLPVPDGAALWSPRGLPVPAASSVGCAAAGDKLEAMVLKAAWLAGAAVEKGTFRQLQLAGEDGVTKGMPGISAFSKAVLQALDVVGMRDRRTRNARRVEDGVASLGGPWAVLLPSSGGDVPFNVQLVCNSGEARDALRSHLAGAGVFAPVHWPQPWEGVSTGDERAEDLAARILTVPLDHRYGDADVDRVLELLSNFA
ncbi:hypothetical protein [Pseudonocardia sp.]|uniref:hypothetical protein n=1 Tax=Pseudonocardia sp. TaxID=60912 RepID=UPI003D0A3944